MPLVVAAILTPADAMLGLIFIAAWMVLMCLKTLAGEFGHAIRVHTLKVEVHRLRLLQRKRLVELDMKASAKATRPSAPAPDIYANDASIAA